MCKICGIYKITSPSGRIYIGQSRDIEYRFKTYKNNYPSTKNQILLARSFSKHGIDSHVFEIVEECSLESLNERERFYQEYYDVLNGGLNCLLTSTKNLPLIFSEEVKQKMSKSASNKEVSEETRNKLSEMKGGERNHMFGKTHSKEAKEKMRRAKIGTHRSDETKTKIGNFNRGKKLSEETKRKIGDGRKGEKNPMWGKSGKNHHNSIPVERYDLEGNFIDEWDNCAHAARELNLNGKAISACVNGKAKTSGGFIWKRKQLFIP